MVEPTVPPYPASIEKPLRGAAGVMQSPGAAAMQQICVLQCRDEREEGVHPRSFLPCQKPPGLQRRQADGPSLGKASRRFHACAAGAKSA